jgi:hypothetical protein
MCAMMARFRKCSFVLWKDVYIAFVSYVVQSLRNHGETVRMVEYAAAFADSQC